MRSKGRQGSWPPFNATFTRPPSHPRESWRGRSAGPAPSLLELPFFAATFSSSICSLLKTFFAPQSSITFTSLSLWEASSDAAFDAPRMISVRTGAKLLRNGSSFVRAAKKMSLSRVNSKK